MTPCTKTSSGSSYRFSKFNKQIAAATLCICITTVTSQSVSAANDHTAPETRKNDYPTVLLHGFFGWGRDEMQGFKHFGGFNDIQESLKAHGYHTVTPAVGPLSSNWDRACELYAQLTGSIVDYGAAHAKAHRHARFGPDYRNHEAYIPGLNEGNQKVNILAHSQGAQTARLLIALLENGNQDEINSGVSDLSPLFSGEGRNWVHALTTLAGAHDGSPLAHNANKNKDLNNIIEMLVNVVNIMGGDAVFDLKLDQFGLAPRAEGENLRDYLDRSLNSFLDEHSTDTAFYDLSSDGAARLNGKTNAVDSVYYFSWANESSTPSWFTGKHYPELGTNLFLVPMVSQIGQYQDTESDYPITESWWENDGITSTRGMPGPINNSIDTVVPYSGTIYKGVWNFMGTRHGYDHWDMIGLLDIKHSPAQNDIIPFYVNAAQFMASTPE
ncbi:thermostable and organic solvent-tolerant lipase [Oleiphilus messinensis]|uniref:triacylglycerol lipase n=1 Tax=Oleiphilus messinensis TaxID=141451 RepID=A0A1Y0I8F4_9GAMM|nr:hypothetical protein [Oleiphilus messinensis]ARU56479.1 thermostable and organic solvent-tolerant lipase [Oleiphilus messinensis]